MITRLKKWAVVIHAWLERRAERAAPYVEKVLGRLPNKEEQEAVDFATDADLAIIRQEPLRARVLLRAIGLVILLFITWAALARRTVAGKDLVDQWCDGNRLR